MAERDLAEQRRQYTREGLRRAQLVDDPQEQLQRWVDEAVAAPSPDWFEPTAMTLATTGLDGDVTARVVLLKGIDGTGLRFFTSYSSAKGDQLAQNPRAAVVLYWPHLERQVRVEGTVEKLNRAESEDYFHSRPRGSQVSAAISSQSRPVIDRTVLEKAAADLEQRLAGAPVPLPEDWGGYRLVPTRFEFWQGRSNRLHDRLVYTRHENAWQIGRLAP